MTVSRPLVASGMENRRDGGEALERKKASFRRRYNGDAHSNCYDFSSSASAAHVIVVDCCILRVLWEGSEVVHTQREFREKLGAKRHSCGFD